MIESIIPKGNIDFNNAGLLVKMNGFVHSCTQQNNLTLYIYVQNNLKIVLNLLKEK